MPTRSFRDSFLTALTDSGLTLAEVARGSGVSAEQLKKLKARPQASTNVEDAKRIADFFGVSLDEFLGDAALKHPIEIISLYTRLPDHLKARFEAYGSGLLEGSDHADRESP